MSIIPNYMGEDFCKNIIFKTKKIQNKNKNCKIIFDKKSLLKSNAKYYIIYL